MALVGLAQQCLSRPDTNACFRLFGPHKTLTIYAESVFSADRFPIYGYESSKDDKPNLRFHRILPDGQRQSIGSATLPSLSSSVYVTVHDQEIKMTTDATSSTGARTFDSPLGELRWKPKASGTGYELLDKRKKLLAKYQLFKSDGTGEPTLEIYVAGDEYWYDMVVATGLAFRLKEDKEGKQAFKLIKRLVL